MGQTNFIALNAVYATWPLHRKPYEVQKLGLTSLILAYIFLSSKLKFIKSDLKIVSTHNLQDAFK